MAAFAVPVWAARPKVLIIGIDGLRTDALLAADAPNIKALMADGCWTDECSAGEITVSGPGWSSILCGVWMDKHGVRNNQFQNPSYDAYPHFFVRLKQARPELVTAHFVTWKQIDEHILGRFQPDFRAFHDMVKDEGDQKVADLARRTLAEHGPDATFVYFGDVDETGHAHGFSPFVPEYLAEIADTDTKIGQVVAAIRSRPRLADEDWLILLTTDHGGSLDKNHGLDEPAHRKVLFVASGPSAARGRLHQTVNHTDIAVTALAHLGIAAKKAWGLDGRPVGSPIRTPLGRNLIFNGDAESSTGHASLKSNVGAAGWRDWGGMTVVPYGAARDLPTETCPGPKERGRNFFCGGTTQLSEMTQMIDVADLAGDIDAGSLRYTLTGYFGGFDEQRDLAWLVARFLDARGAELAAARAGPATLEDRRRQIGRENDSLTGLVECSTTGDLPPGTRRISIKLTAEAAEGDNDGYADDLSFVLERRH